MAAYEVLLLNTAVPQIQAAQAGDTYVVPRDIAVNAALTINNVANTGITSLVSSGANKWNIYASGTAANYFAGVTTFSTAASLTNVAGSITPQVQIRGSTANTGSFLITRNSNDTNGPSFWLGKDRGGGAAVNNDILGLIRLAGNDGTSYVEAARIVAEVDGTPGANDMPGRLVFSTTADGASSPTERLRIDSTGASIFKPAAGTGAVFNEDGVDADFRVESDTNTHALFVQGSDGFVGIGRAAPSSLLSLGSSVTNKKFFVYDDGSTAYGLGMAAGELRQFAHTGQNLTFGNYALGTDSFTERLRIDSSGNVKIGGTADRATTVGTKHLDIFDGTAPVGTLANGISIYSSSGEAYVMDAAGNATLFSPHDAETNEWIFKSKHTPTGKVLKIDVERLLKFVNDHFGLDAVHEFIED